MVALGASSLWVVRVYVYFATLPNANVELVTEFGTTDGAWFKVSDSKIYAGYGAGTMGATGVAVTTGIWYRIDVKIKKDANPHLIDVQVDGVACGQASNASEAGSPSVIKLGSGANFTGDIFLDDLVVSNTLADFPIGAGYVNHFVPTADGTHNVAGANDFERTLTGVDIVNATTDAYLLVDDVPLESSPTDWIGMEAPPNATDYVECIFGAAPGISTPTNPPRAVEVIAGIHQLSTATGNMEIRMNDNGTTDAMYSATGVAGVTTIAYKRKHYASAIAGGGAWVIGGGVNGDFTDLRVRFGSPAALDVNPDQYFDCIMIEAEFTSAGQFSLVVVGASYAFTTAAASLLAQRKLVATNAVYAFTEATVTLRKGFKLVTQEAVYSFTPADVTFSVTRKLIVTAASYSLSTQDAAIVAQRKLAVTPASYAFSTADAGLAKGYKFIVDAAAYALTTQPAGITAQRKLLVTSASYSFSTQPAPILAQRKLPTVNAVYLFTAQDAGLNFSGGGTVFGVDPAIYSFSAASAGLTVQRKLSVDGAVYNYSDQSVALKAARIFSVQQAGYFFTTQDAGLSSGVLVSTYRMVAVKTKYKFNSKTAKLIGPRRPGLVKLISPTEV